MATEEIAKRPISKQDARDLVKIIENRFGRLQGRVAQRELELATKIRQDVYDTHAKSIEDARRAFIDLGQRAHELEAEYMQTIDAAQSSGLRVRGNWTVGWRSPEVDVADVEQVVRQRIAEMRAQGGQHKLSLHEQEQELKERITIASLTGEQALGFLDQIPSVDEVLPLPNGFHEAIEAATEEEAE